MRSMSTATSGGFFGLMVVNVLLVAENAESLRSLSYSRGLETDADLHGMERMHAAGVDPHGMVELLIRRAKVFMLRSARVDPGTRI